jgi:hypothetical protein
MKRMYFQKEGTSEKCIPPSLKNFIFTLEGFVDLTKMIISKDIEYFFTRSFNQDPLENYFGQIRQHRGRNVNPTSEQFASSYKSLLIRNIAGYHSVSANCEKTFENSLFTLENLIKSGRNFERTIVDGIQTENPAIYQYISKMSDDYFERPLGKATMGYIAGFVGKKVLKKFSCEFCKIHILKTEQTDQSFLSFTSERVLRVL